MRLLSGLTTRGRAFVAAGLTAGVCAFLLGQRDLLRVGVLLALFPLVAALVVSRSRLAVRAQRHVDPPEIPVGASADVELVLSNHGRMPSGWLMLEDKIPYGLGRRPRFVLNRVSPRWERQVSYRISSEVRGRYQVGPLLLTVADPFGLVETMHVFPQVHQLLVTPRLQQLPPVNLGSDRTGTGDTRLRALAAAGEEDATVREYRDGDDLRRVHWPASAKHGELMVRREEQPWQSRCALLLDTRTAVHAGLGRTASVEWAVSAAASIGTDVIRRGYETTLYGGPVTLDLVSSQIPAMPRAISAHDLLVECATAGEHSAEGLSGLLSLAGNHEPSLTIAIVGACSDADIAALTRWRSTQSSGIALVLDAASWLQRDETAGTWPAEARRIVRPGGAIGAYGANGTNPANGSDGLFGAGATERSGNEHRAHRLARQVDITEEALRRSGWRVARVRRGDQLPSVWAGLSRRAGRIA